MVVSGESEYKDLSRSLTFTKTGFPPDLCDMNDMNDAGNTDLLHSARPLTTCH